MNDKFIMIELEDSKSKKVAEILKNKTAKKILNYLSDVKDASETDMATELKIPLNTLEYNLKKLIDAGLVKKTKKFFWSKRGKKIPMYALAKKHIIISPKGSRPSANALRAVLPVLGILAIGAILALLALHTGNQHTAVNGSLRQFNSYNEMEDFLKTNRLDYDYYYVERTTEDSQAVEAGDKSFSDSSEDYSTTNIQVEGVDEPDFIKNDGKYIYAVSAGKVYIIDAYPAENMKKISEIDINGSIRRIFINKNKLIAFVNEFNTIYPKFENYEIKNSVNIYDISDRKNPVLEHKIGFDGYYSDARMIGDYVYVISTKYIDVENPIPPIYLYEEELLETKATDIYYYPGKDTGFIFTSVLALALDNASFETETYLLGNSNKMYFSKDNIYLTNTKTIDYEEKFEKRVKDVYSVIMPELKEEFEKILDSNENLYEKFGKIKKLIMDYVNSLDSSDKDDFSELLKEKLNEFEFAISKEYETTIINRINVDKLNIKHTGTGEVPGHILNQFSMDEFNGSFRIATTTGNSWSNTSLNHVFILDKDLNIAGSVDDLARGERIYSARFIKDKLYMVTFRQIDPFYVIDLSNPSSPEVLGYLKIPGYSTYLHPFENKIIGIGKDENSNIKISLFDVSNFENPIELDKYVVEADYSDSYALYEHKAFLFDENTGLMVIPIETLNYKNNSVEWSGALVFEVDNKINLKAKIIHEPEEDYWRNTVKRSLYIGDYLYTISDRMIKANKMNDDFRLINSFIFPYQRYTENL